MIKTHRPRGHFWTCPSLFQGTKEIRNINFEDCTPPETEVIAQDSDEELQPKQRTAKRRRIEKLADDFLNGQPLVFSYVRPHPSTLKSAVEGNERSRAAAKYVMPSVELPDDDSELWVDIEDLSDSSKDAVKARESSKGHVIAKQRRARRKAAMTAPGTVTEEQASSACKSARVVKAVKVSLEPSTDAVKRAAALRDRRLQRAATDVPRVPEGPSSDTAHESDTAEPRSEPDSVVRPRSVRTRKPLATEWLLRRPTTLYEFSADESVDELNRSAIETPSRPTQPPAGPPSTRLRKQGLTTEDASPGCSAEEAPTDVSGKLVTQSRSPGRILIGAYQEHWECSADATISSVDLIDRAAEAGTSPGKGCYHNAPEETLGVASALPQNESQADSQSRLLRRQGIHAAPRKSWTSTNDAAAPQPALSTTEKLGVTSLSSSRVTAIRESVQESAQRAGKANKGKRAKSAGNQKPQAADPLPRRRSAPTETQGVPEQVQTLPLGQRHYTRAIRAYKQAETNGSDDTPFMFRKLTLNAGGTAGREGDTKSLNSRRGPMNFLSSEDDSTKRIGGENEVAQPVSVEAPVLDVSLGNDSFAPKLNLALANEHLNAVLPDESVSAGRSSAIKRAIKRELKDSGAQIPRMEGELPSSQIEGLAEAHALSFNAINAQGGSGGEGAEDACEQVPAVKESVQTHWLGTQALLCQAHNDFFESPEKAREAPGNDETGSRESSKAGAEQAPSSAVREPLRVLSQEPLPLPSTQAMVEAWSPWSTVKKPNGVTARARVPSPSLVNNRKLHAGGASATSDASIKAARRRSSLRFSTSTIESPSTQLPFTVTKAASLEQRKP